MQDDKIKEQWHAMLKLMLDEYRANNPDDSRTDKQLLESLMEHFAESGIVKKENGKFVLPEILPDA